jgi:uncharacterized membrane protein
MATISDVRTAAAASIGTAAAQAERLVSLDMIRGIVMVLMALDHVRVYSGVPAGGPTAAIFFTRWVTHFCAPAFAFLAGTSAYLSGRRRTAPELSSHLLTRGAWLVLLELTVIRVAWTFNFDYSHYVLFGVIWMLGICMMLMAPLVRAQLSPRTIAFIGLSVILLQDLIGLAAQSLPQAARAATAPFWQFLYFGGVIRLGGGGAAIAAAGAGAAANEAGTALAVLYSIVPWIGVMATGYAFGTIVTRDPAARRRACLWIGLSATALFVVIAGAFVLMSSNTNVPAFVRFLNQRKYPASQLFLLMTLGPTIAFIPLADHMRARASGVTTAISNALAVFGRVPFFYYLLHIPLIHVAAMLVSLLREGRVNPWLFGNHPMMPPPLPDGYMWSLPLLYLVWAIVIATLYLPCRWFAEKKRASPKAGSATSRTHLINACASFGPGKMSLQHFRADFTQSLAAARTSSSHSSFPTTARTVALHPLAQPSSGLAESRAKSAASTRDSRLCHVVMIVCSGAPPDSIATIVSSIKSCTYSQPGPQVQR